jgi:hypothetical protein
MFSGDGGSVQSSYGKPKKRSAGEALVPHEGTPISVRVEGVPGLIRVECEDPLVASCAACLRMAQEWGYDPVEVLPWAVIEHWLSEHWDRAGLDEQADGA